MPSRPLKLRSLIVSGTSGLIALYSDPANLSDEAHRQFDAVASQLDGISDRLKVGPDGLVPSAEASDQPPWGVTEDEIQFCQHHRAACCLIRSLSMQP